MQVDCTPSDPVPLAPLLYHPPDHFVNYQGTTAPGADPRPPFSRRSYSYAVPKPTLTLAVKAQYLKLRRPRGGAPERREWRRGSVTAFTARSRSRMLQSLAQVQQNDGTPDCLWITLTYPEWYPSSVRRCKMHLKAWEMRVRRAFPRAWFYWKLEFQVRGAPHFHLLVFDTGAIVEDWWHTAWFEVVNSGEHFHWFYGSKVQRLYSWKAAGSYCAKYCAKEDVQQVCDSPGRFWGIVNRKARPATLVEAEITDAEFYIMRRAIVRFMGQRHGFHGKGGPTSGVWCRMSEGGAKRLLAYATSSQGPPMPSGEGSCLEGTFAGDMLQPCTDQNSRDAGGPSERTSSARIPHRPNYRLFDSLDGQAAWARRWN